MAAAPLGFLNFSETRMTSVTQDTPATKADGGKARMDLIAPEALVALGAVLEFGSRKYAERNWEKGMRWGRVYAALQRHLTQWMMGDDVDDESGMPHLWHALTNLHFLVAYADRDVGEDDRPVIQTADNDNGEDEVDTPIAPVVYHGSIDNDNDDAMDGMWVDYKKPAHVPGGYVYCSKRQRWVPVSSIHVGDDL